MTERVFLTTLTPPRPGGIGSLAVWGEGAGEFMRSLVPGIKEGIPCYRKLREGNEVVDEVVALLIPKASAPTGNEEGELCFHGGKVPQKQVVEFLKRRGAEEASFRQYIQNFVKYDAIQKEAFYLLPQGKSLRCCAFLLRQLEGELSRLIRSQLEQRDKGRLRLTLEKLLQRSDFARVLTQGASILVVGPPNAGKSTLVNRLCGSERAIVTEIPGTTRDILEAPWEIAGVPITLLDTAGLRKEATEIELLGTELLAEALRTADLVLCLGIEPEELPCPPRKAVALGPKADLGETYPPHVIPVSGLTGLGLEGLKQRILAELGAPSAEKLSWSEDSPPDPVGFFTSRQVKYAERALKLLKEGNAEEARSCVERILSDF